MSEKTILHVDMDAFFAAIEQQDHPELRGRPVVVGAPPDKRGVVATCSYEARRFGVRSAMPSRTAYARCPQAVFLPVRMRRYREVSDRIFDLFHRFTPLVEPLSLDEAFLDVTGARHLFGDGLMIAKRIQVAVRAEIGLTCSIGVAGNLFLAKVASDLHKPDGVTLVPNSEKAIAEFLAPLPVGRMWGAGEKTRAILESHQVFTFGDLRRTDETTLATWVGPRAAAAFRRLAFGRDDREVQPDGIEKSISNEITFDEDLTDHALVEKTLLDLADRVGSRLRHAGFYAGTAQIKVRWKDFTTRLRQRRLRPACCDDMTLRRVALELFRAESRTGPVRLVGFGVKDLRPTPDERPAQPMLFDLEPATSGGLSTGEPPPGKREALSRTLDRIQDRYGTQSLRRGSSLDAPMQSRQSSNSP